MPRIALKPLFLAVAVACGASSAAHAADDVGDIAVLVVMGFGPRFEGMALLTQAVLDLVGLRFAHGDLRGLFAVVRCCVV